MYYYINKEGQYIHADGVVWHTKLAELILKSSPEIMKKFIQSGKKYPDDFLLENLGYIKVRDDEFVKECTYYSRIMNEFQLSILERYAANGYELVDITSGIILRKKLAGLEEKPDDSKGDKNG